MLPFGSHQTPLYKGSRRVAGEPRMQRCLLPRNLWYAYPSSPTAVLVCGGETLLDDERLLPSQGHREAFAGL